MATPSLEITHFLRDILGCTCPEALFRKIEFQKEAGKLGKRKINVGGRLLIHIVNWHGDMGVVKSAIKSGVEERNAGGFNRFRLVLVSSDPEKLRTSVEQVFLASAYRDEKTHLHFLNETDVMDLF